MVRPTIVIVTGANRGLGEAIAQNIASTTSLGPLVLYATSRKGLDMGFRTSPEKQVKYSSLDIADKSSIESLVDTIKKEHKTVDVLVNNAGVYFEDKYNPQNVKTTFDVNVRGTLQMCLSFLPLLNPSSRIVNISSVGSSLSKYSPAIQSRFRDPKITFCDVESVMQEYQDAAIHGTETEKGWHRASYSVSKACVNALTVILARDNKDLIVNACCPGWVDTDMGRAVGTVGPAPPKTLSDGARIPLRLAFGDIENVTGRYWANPSVWDTGDGQVEDW